MVCFTSVCDDGQTVMHDFRLFRIVDFLVSRVKHRDSQPGFFLSRYIATIYKVGATSLARSENGVITY
jgi:hypothetical protein